MQCLDDTQCPTGTSCQNGTCSSSTDGLCPGGCTDQFPYCLPGAGDPEDGLGLPNGCVQCLYDEHCYAFGASFCIANTCY